ncbi:site-specific integrase [Vibrio diabolicus]|uniref:tyrosine-type recombinase/integrase n=1 Tax=Vibrio diabolicus TaxID=50719 RepID=UPI00215FAF4B|nr:site-specific integrase [Vibrio diabolicus]MCS0397901.1 site-specific integrase [Vibrio diabolicus]
MADIRKRTGKKGTTYQVRYACPSTKSGYAFKTFSSLKSAKAFIEDGGTKEKTSSHYSDIQSVPQAVNLWLKICEKEGLNGREPVTAYTYKNYEYRSEFIKQYSWQKNIQELTPPDIVAFRSWLLKGNMSRALASKVLSSFQSVMKEMSIRGVLPHNVATGICIRSDARYQEPVVIPSKGDIVQLLAAADRLANSKNAQIERTWRRYRPMLYLAVDSGMRPQEYLALSASALDDSGVYVDRAIDGSGHSITVTKTPAGRRYIELSPETVDMVRHYIENYTVDNKYDLVFPASNGRWMCRRNWQRRGFNVACIEAGLAEQVTEREDLVVKPKYRPYDLRHFFASMLIEKKVNLKKIQTLMGHSNIETTLNTYGHLLVDENNDKREKAGMLNGMLFNSCGKSVARDS